VGSFENGETTGRLTVIFPSFNMFYWRKKIAIHFF